MSIVDRVLQQPAAQPPDVSRGGLPGGRAAIRLQAVRRRRLISGRPPCLLHPCTVDDILASLDCRAGTDAATRTPKPQPLLVLLPSKLYTQQPEAGGGTNGGLGSQEEQDYNLHSCAMPAERMYGYACYRTSALRIRRRSGRVPACPHGRARTWDAGDVDAAALAVGELRQAGVHDVAARQGADARVQRLPLRPVAKQQDVRSAGEVVFRLCLLASCRDGADTLLRTGFQHQGGRPDAWACGAAVEYNNRLVYTASAMAARQHVLGDSR